ncbi:unnamed protein product [Zymoseptoria tritici ST99CH_3D1]|nr:unnamed protein product [Zymoseptoria tritici ST99CH_3D1]
MPGLARKLLIFAAVDGVFLLPVGNRGAESNSKGFRIDYGTNTVSSATKQDDGDERALEVHGIVGLLNLVSSSYLISITKREEVAQLWDKPVFTIRDVTLIPLASRAEAQRAISSAQGALKQNTKAGELEDTDVSDVGEDAETSSIGSDDDNAPQSKPEDEAAALEVPKTGIAKQSTTFVKDVVQGKGNYGRFATKWFSKNGGQANARRSQGLTREQESQELEALPDDKSAEASPRPSGESGRDDKASGQEFSKSGIKKRTTIERLTPRILRSARLYFSSGGFYFSYEHNLSTMLSQHDSNSSSVPLWKRFDSLFFWNSHLLKPFTDAGHDALALPLIQGFVGQRNFSIARKTGSEKDTVHEKEPQSTDGLDEAFEKPSQPLDSNSHELLLTLISRRSIKRAGLRYLRRGIDDEGYVANNVETEQILSSKSWNPSEKTFSLVQVRGSMPLFFSQSPYSFKPLPVLFGSEATNQTAFRKHFAFLSQRYGRCYAASLVDKHGTEVVIGEKYQHHAELLNTSGGIDSRPLGFEWFDFHSACKGMKFENVSLLMSTLEPSLHSFCWNERQNSQPTRKQSGVLRTNCMDCLDRTNVVQSAVAGWALQQQLAELDLSIDLKTDMGTQWFNTLWADNGDAISKQYAGTSALKGDFTRTRKRNWTGALSDFSLTLNRYYNNIFGDYFLQTNIDYLLGNAGPLVFEEFETDMMSQDYALDMRSVRQNAIDTCIKIVLEDPKEDFLSGWTLSCPRQSNSLRTLPMEECVLLLTDAALYFCRFDWETEKVGSFERVEMLDLKALWRGTYITSTLGEAHLDESRNVGFAVKYSQSGGSVVRTNTRSLSVSEGPSQEEAEKKSGKANEVLLAFKALPAKASAVKGWGTEEDMSEGELVRHICEEIRKTWEKAARKDRGGELGSQGLVVEERDVLSAADARKSTTYIESLGYSLKKLVWS